MALVWDTAPRLDEAGREQWHNYGLSTGGEHGKSPDALRRRRPAGLDFRLCNGQEDAMTRPGRTIVGSYRQVNLPDNSARSSATRRLAAVSLDFSALLNPGSRLCRSGPAAAQV